MLKSQSKTTFICTYCAFSIQSSANFIEKGLAFIKRAKYGQDSASLKYEKHYMSISEHKKNFSLRSNDYSLFDQG